MAWARLYAWTSTLLPQHRCRPAAHRTPGWPPFKDGLFSFQHDRSPVHTAASVTRLLEDSCETGVDSVKPEHAFRGCVEKKCLPNEGILPSHFLHGSILHVLHVSISYMSAHSMRALVCAATALMPPHVCHFARQPLHPVLCPCFVSFGVFRHGVVCKLHSCLQVESCRVPTRFGHSKRTAGGHFSIDEICVLYWRGQHDKLKATNKACQAFKEEKTVRFP